VAAPPAATAKEPVAVAAPKPTPLQPEEAAIPTKKALPIVPILIGIVIALLAAGGAAWYFLRTKPAPPTPSTPVAKAPAPAPAPEPKNVEPPPVPEAAATGTVASRPKTARVAKRAPAPAPPPVSPALSPEQVKLANLENLAREAYAQGNYAEPAEASAIAYAKQALAVSPNDDYAKRLLEDAIHGGTYQVQQAIVAKDFATARRIAGVMIQLLPGRKDVAGLREDIASGERRQ
jgi:flagellar basal body-associated protein FliL